MPPAFQFRQHKPDMQTLHRRAGSSSVARRIGSSMTGSAYRRSPDRARDQASAAGQKFASVADRHQPSAIKREKMFASQVLPGVIHISLKNFPARAARLCRLPAGQITQLNATPRSDAIARRRALRPTRRATPGAPVQAPPRSPPPPPPSSACRPAIAARSHADLRAAALPGRPCRRGIPTRRDVRKAGPD